MHWCIVPQRDYYIFTSIVYKMKKKWSNKGFFFHLRNHLFCVCIKNVYFSSQVFYYSFFLEHRYLVPIVFYKTCLWLAPFKFKLNNKLFQLAHLTHSIKKWCKFSTTTHTYYASRKPFNEKKNSSRELKWLPNLHFKRAKREERL